METSITCDTCKKEINGTYVTCNRCVSTRVCTRCHNINAMHHEHGELKPLSVATNDNQPPIKISNRFYGVAKMFSSQSGRRGNEDDSESS